MKATEDKLSRRDNMQQKSHKIKSFMILSFASTNQSFSFTYKTELLIVFAKWQFHNIDKNFVIFFDTINRLNIL